MRFPLLSASVALGLLCACSSTPAATSVPLVPTTVVPTSTVVPATPTVLPTYTPTLVPPTNTLVPTRTPTATPVPSPESYLLEPKELPTDWSQISLKTVLDRPGVVSYYTQFVDPKGALLSNTIVVGSQPFEPKALVCQVQTQTSEKEVGIGQGSKACQGSFDIKPQVSLSFYKGNALVLIQILSKDREIELNTGIIL